MNSKRKTPKIWTKKTSSSSSSSSASASLSSNTCFAPVLVACLNRTILKCLNNPYQQGLHVFPQLFDHFSTFAQGIWDSQTCSHCLHAWRPQRKRTAHPCKWKIDPTWDVDLGIINAEKTHPKPNKKGGFCLILLHVFLRFRVYGWNVDHKIGRKRDLVWEINSPARMQGFSWQIWTWTLQTFYTNMPFEFEILKQKNTWRHHSNSITMFQVVQSKFFLKEGTYEKKPTNGIHVWHIQPHVGIVAALMATLQLQSFGESMCFICGPYGTIWGFGVVVKQVRKKTINQSDLRVCACVTCPKFVLYAYQTKKSKNPVLVLATCKCNNSGFATFKLEFFELMMDSSTSWWF